MSKVSKDGKFGFINKEAQEVIPFKYSFAGDFSEGLAPVSNDKNLWGYIDKTGKEMISFRFDYTDTFNSGIASVVKNGKDVNIDKSGKESN